MADFIAAPPVNPLISIQPLTTSAPGRDAAGVPPQLAATPPGTLVEGFVVNRDGQSNPILRTVLGDILVKSDVFIKTGSEVVFRVEPAQQGAARIISIDGMTPQDYAATQARGLRTDTITNMADPAQTMNLARGTPIGQPLQALLINSTPPTAAAIAGNPLLAGVLAANTPLPSGLLKLQQGAQLKVAILDMQLPALDKPTQPAQTLSAQAAAPQTTTPAPTSPLAMGAQKDAPVQPLQAAQVAANAATARIAQGPAPAAPNAPAATIPPTSAPITAAQVAAPAPATAAQISPPTAPVQPLAVAAQTAPPTAPAAPAAVATAPTPSTTAAPVPAPIATRTPQQNAVAVHSYAHVPQPAMQAAPPRQTPTVPLPANAVPAVVIANEKQGEAVLQTPVGLLKLPLPRPVPVGTSLHIVLEPLPRAPQAPSLPGGLPPSGVLLEQMSSFAREWPALDQAAQWAQASDPILARQMMQALPTIGPKLTSGLLFFLAAVKGGELRQVIGNRAVAQLEARAPEIASRLKADMAQLQQFFTESPLPHWQTAMVPLFHQGQLEHARLFFRQDGHKDDESGSKTSGKDQRFIVEVDLSHLGEMQFDGFVRGAARAKQFDLIVRSSLRLPEELLGEIRTSFDNAMQTTGLKGYLAFQQGSQHFVRPLADAPAPREGGSAQPILA